MSNSERAAALAGLRLGLVLLVLLMLLLYWAFSDDSLARADRRLRLTPANAREPAFALPLSGETRMAWTLNAGKELRFSVRVPGDHPVLRLRLAALSARPELSVRIVRGNGKTEEVARLPSSDAHWKAEQVELPASAGEPIEVELAALGTAARPALGTLMIADVVLESEGRDVRPGERPLAVRHLREDLLSPRALERIAAPSGVMSARVKMAGPACLELLAGQPEGFAVELVEHGARLEIVLRVHPQSPNELIASARFFVHAHDQLLSNVELSETARPGPEGLPAYEVLVSVDLAAFEGEPLDFELSLQGGDGLFIGLREVLITAPQVVPRRAPDPEQSKRVVLVMVDGLRADRLGVLGYENGHTPNLDALAHSGTLWSNVMLPSSWNVPNVATLLTGRSPLVHGLGLASGRHLSPRLATLAHWASWAGVSTAALSSSRVIGPLTGLDSGFDHSEYLPVPATVLVEHAVDWLHEVAPFDSFLVLHLGDLLPPHESEPQDYRVVNHAADPDLIERLRPMDPRPGVAESLAHEIGPLYDAELARVDRAVGVLVAGIQELDQWSSTLFVVVGTHGQEFFEHGGRGSGQSLFNEVVSVPALFVGPGIEALDAPVSEPVVLEDLTVLIGQLSGLASADALPGRQPPPYGPGAGTERTMHSLLMPFDGITTRTMEASRRDNMLLLSDPVLDLQGFYDLSVDPFAEHDLLLNLDDLVIRTEAEALAEDFEAWFRDELTLRAAWPVSR